MSEGGESDCSFESSSEEGEEFDEFGLGGAAVDESSYPESSEFDEEGVLSSPSEVESFGGRGEPGDSFSLVEEEFDVSSDSDILLPL